MQNLIHLNQRPHGLIHLVPDPFELGRPLTLALHAWAMASGEGGCFIEKKEFGVVAGAHYLAMPASEFAPTEGARATRTADQG